LCYFRRKMGIFCLFFTKVSGLRRYNARFLPLRSNRPRLCGPTFVESRMQWQSQVFHAFRNLPGRLSQKVGCIRNPRCFPLSCHSHRPCRCEANRVHSQSQVLPPVIASHVLVTKQSPSNLRNQIGGDCFAKLAMTKNYRQVIASLAMTKITAQDYFAMPAMTKNHRRGIASLRSQ
jgi:hypothetical protein